MPSPAQPILLGVNIDHAATLRQARYRQAARDCGLTIEPDPVLIAQLAEHAGADGITVHLREDRRHIQEEDVRRLRDVIATRLNLEMAATPAMLAFARDIRPDSACLVPENRAEITTEGGLDAAGQRQRIGETVAALRAEGIAVSLFIDPQARQLEAAAALQADAVELHTGAFANAWHSPHARHAQLDLLRTAAAQAHEHGLTVNAGHGINYHNIPHIRSIPWLHELNIGHAILSRALVTGIAEAVREIKARINGQLR